MHKIKIRAAKEPDAADIAEVLTQSIQQLCHADHKNDPDRIAVWIANKTPEQVRIWIKAESQIWVTETDGQIGGVGLATPVGEVTLLYVAPRFQGAGHGAALLNHMEHQFKQNGVHIARLVSTKTALEFYKHQGWRQDGSPMAGKTLDGYPMAKALLVTKA